MNQPTPNQSESDQDQNHKTHNILDAVTQDPDLLIDAGIYVLKQTEKSAEDVLESAVEVIASIFGSA